MADRLASYASVLLPWREEQNRYPQLVDIRVAVWWRLPPMPLAVRAWNGMLYWPMMAAKDNGSAVACNASALAGTSLISHGEGPMPGKQPYATVDEYIGTFPADVQTLLVQVRQAIRTAASEATETITYGIPTYDLHGKHLVFFAGWKHHISVYPLPMGDSAFQQRIAPFKRVKSTIQLPLTQPIPCDLITELVTFLQREKLEANDPAGQFTDTE